MRRLGLFRLGEISFAIPLARLLKIHNCIPCYPLPRLPEGICGVVVNGQQLVPVVDLFSLLPGASGRLNGTEYQILGESECGTIAFPATATCGIVAEQKGHLTSVEAETAQVTANFEYQQRIFQVLDIDSLVIGLTQGA